MKSYGRLVILILIQFSWITVMAQDHGQIPSGYQPVISKVQNSSSNEKIYLHINTNNILTGEDLMFRVYCLDRNNGLSSFSKVAYIELINDQGKAVYQGKVRLEDGLGSGDVFIPSSLPTSNYTLVAYTQWMKNWSSQCFFRTEIAVINPFQATRKSVGKADSAHWDIQFLPEGGSFLTGVSNRIGFRVVDQEGKGQEFEGHVIDDNENVITEFYPLVSGIGRLDITPQPGNRYTAVIVDSTGRLRRAGLPQVQAQGVSLRVDRGVDHYNATILSAGSYLGELLLVLHNQGEILHAQLIDMTSNSRTIELMDNLFPDGVSVLTLFSSKAEPLCERLIFNKPEAIPSPEVFADKQVYANRERVDLEIRTGLKNTKGNLSVSVRQTDVIPAKPRVSIVESLLLTTELNGTIENLKFYLDENFPQAEQALDNLMLVHGWRTFDHRWESELQNPPQYLPDLRGQVFSGKVLRSSDKARAPNQLVYLSVPGKEYQFHASRTNLNGEFFFITNEIESATEVVLQTDPKLSNILTIVPNNGFLNDHSGLEPAPLFLDTGTAQGIISRSVTTQVENAYYENKGDSTLSTKGYERFYRKAHRVYELDDYTRFVLMEEVITELIGSVFIRKKNDGYSLKVKDYQNKYIVFQENPLVLIDGIPVFDLNQIIEYDPLKVEKIEVLTQRFLYGPLDCKGIMSFETYDGKADGFSMDPEALKFNYVGVQPSKRYFSPIYNSQSSGLSRIPDFRTQLHWDPQLSLDPDGVVSISFYTSDLEGSFEVSIQGILENGQPMTMEVFLKVAGKGIQ